MKAPRIASGALGQPGQWNELHDDAQGSATLLAHSQLGSYSLATNPTNGQAISFDVNGTTITLTGRTGAISAAGDFAIQATSPLTLAVIMNQLQNPWTTNSTQIALTLANQELLAYVGFALSGTTITAYSLNTTLNAPLTSFSGSTTFSSGTYTAQTMEVFVEPGVFYIGTTQVKFAGGSSPTVTAPVSHPRIDLLTINTSGVLAWTTGTENASPVPPSYPFGVVPICELWNVVSETILNDNANQSSSQGYISADVRPFNNVIYINNNSQLAAGVILASNLGNAGTCATGSIVMFAASSAPSGWIICDGSAVSRTTYATLFSTIGTTFGVGDGSTTFNLPNFQGNVPVGFKTGDTNFGTLGQTGGEVTHLLTITEMPSHAHGLSLNGSGGAAFSVTAPGVNGSTSNSTGSNGGGGAHNNLQPYLTVYFIIKT